MYEQLYFYDQGREWFDVMDINLAQDIRNQEEDKKREKQMLNDIKSLTIQD